MPRSATNLVLIHVKPALVETFYKARVRTRRPHGENATRPKRGTSGAQSFKAIQGIVSVASKRFRTIVDIK